MKGVLNMWGQMSFPVKYSNAGTPFPTFWADYGNTNIPPMIAFHGNLDSTVPIGQSKIKFAPYTSLTVPRYGLVNYRPYNTESHSLLSTVAGPYKLDPSANSVDLYGQGSKGIYDIFLTLGISNETYIDCDAEHGLDSPQDVADNDGVFRSNYGTIYTTAADVNIYIVQRAATFFQAVLTNKDASLQTDLFYDWENKRVKSYPPATLNDKPTICPTCNQPCTTTPNFDNPNEE